MTRIAIVAAGCAAAAALAGAAPAAAQAFPGYGMPYGFPGGVYPGAPAYPGYPDADVPGGSRIAASQCSAAVQQRLGGYAYGYGGGPARVLRIESVLLRPGGGYRVSGLASAGGAYGYGYEGGAMRFNCRTDGRGIVLGVDFNGGAYGNRYYGDPYAPNGYNPYEPNGYNPYSIYGYQRY